MANLDYQESVGANSQTAPSPDDVQISELRQQWLDWASAKTAELEEQRQARHYYHGDQWTTTELKVLKKRGQPPVTFNRVNRKIDGVVGTLKKLWQDAKAYPRTPNHDDDAETATEALRYALDVGRWKPLGIEGTRNAAREGIGCCGLRLEQGDQGDPEIGLDLIDDDTFFYDPRSMKPDFSDAQYMGESKWLDLDVAKGLYPDKAEELDGLVSRGGDVEVISQFDREKNWINVKAKRLRVVEHWYKRQNAWHVCHYTGNTKLAGAPSPWKNEKNKSISRYIAFSAYVDHDGDRYGFVRGIKSPQDEVNQRRSKALFMLNSRRLIKKGPAENIEKIRTEAARPDGVIVVEPGSEIEFEDAVKQAEWQGQMQMLAEAKGEIENFGPTLVEKGMEKSGKAIALLQQAGLAELGPFIDAWADWKLRIYRAVWNGIRQHWTAERWIRVTDDEGAARFVKLNGLEIDEYGQPKMVNQVSSLDVDIILDESPDTVTTMQDVFELLESLAAAGVPVPPAIVIEMSGLPSSMKRRLISKLEQANQPDPSAEQAKQVALQQEDSKTKLNIASAQDKIASASQRYADIAMKPDEFAHEREKADRDTMGRDADRVSRERQSQQRGFQ